MGSKRQATFNIICRHLGMHGLVLATWHSDKELWTVEVKEPTEGKTPLEWPMIACGTNEEQEEAAIDCMSALVRMLGEEQLEFQRKKKGSQNDYQCLAKPAEARGDPVEFEARVRTLLDHIEGWHDTVSSSVRTAASDVRSMLK